MLGPGTTVPKSRPPLRHLTYLPHVGRFLFCDVEMLANDRHCRHRRLPHRARGPGRAIRPNDVEELNSVMFLSAVVLWPVLLASVLVRLTWEWHDRRSGNRRRAAAGERAISRQAGQAACSCQRERGEWLPVMKQGAVRQCDLSDDPASASGTDTEIRLSKWRARAAAGFEFDL
jgi:hypothetical protein